MKTAEPQDWDVPSDRCVSHGGFSLHANTYSHPPTDASWNSCVVTSHALHCDGKMKIIAAIEDPAIIAKILKHLGLSTRAPPREPVRYKDIYNSI